MNFYQLWEQLEGQTVEGFHVYQNMANVPDADIRKEYREEIAPYFQDMRSDSKTMLRWNLTVDQAKRIFGDENHFVQMVHRAARRVLPPSVLKNVWNYSQVEQVIGYWEQHPEGDPVQALHGQRQFFGTKGATDDGKHDKLSSFNHKVDVVEHENPVIYPLLLLHGGKYYHVTGHTRMTAAVVKKMILPVKVISV